MRVPRLFVAALAALSLLVGASAPAPAGPGSLNTVSVVKVVEGTGVPDAGVFEAVVTCTPADGPPIVVTIGFDHTGVPLADDTVPGVPADATCVVEETVTNGAASVTYACQTSMVADAPAAAPEGGSDATCADDRTVVFDNVQFAAGVVTITNTFEVEDPPPPPPPPVPPAPDVSAEDIDPPVDSAVAGGVVRGTPTSTG